jgi:nucleoside-diphosphate-sugar epimerase
MLTHHQPQPAAPARAVLIGGNGFLGRALARRLEAAGVPLLSLGSADIDLAAPGAGADLAARLRPDDAVVVLAALAPSRGRDIAAFVRNIEIARGVCDALTRQPVAHVVAISTDGVYDFGEGLVSEATAPATPDTYGTAHRAREVMFASVVKCPLCVLRPTMLFGDGDPHNSYGPNRFVRLAQKDGRITLGGGGEETRDHVWVEDAARLIEQVLRHRSSGLLNVATGVSISFDALARKVAALFKNDVPVVHTPRGSAITHRSFDPADTLKAFPAFRYTPRDEALRLAYAATLGA